MKTENSNRYRINTKFTSLKVIGYIVFFCTLGNLAWQMYNQTFRQETLVPTLVVVSFAAGMLYFISKQKIVEYDELKQTLYRVGGKQQPETVIPVESISKILYTDLGQGTGYYAYQVVYRGPQGQIEQFWLFPLSFTNYMDTVITDAAIKNPALITRKWGFGRNAFFDK